jgi:hypothetical protein
METKFVRDETMTMSEQMEAVRNSQAFLRLQAEVRNAARANGVAEKDVQALVDKAHSVFRIVNGEAKPVPALQGDPDGLVTVSQWVSEQSASRTGHGNERKAVGTLGPVVEPLPVSPRNPFRRESWNLTEQMRLRRRDPGLAARLQQEA